MLKITPKHKYIIMVAIKRIVEYPKNDNTKRKSFDLEFFTHDIFSITGL